MESMADSKPNGPLVSYLQVTTLELPTRGEYKQAKDTTVDEEYNLHYTVK